MDPCFWWNIYYVISCDATASAITVARCPYGTSPPPAGASQDTTKNNPTKRILPSVPFRYLSSVVTFHYRVITPIPSISFRNLRYYSWKARRVYRDSPHKEKRQRCIRALQRWWVGSLECLRQGGYQVCLWHYIICRWPGFPPKNNLQKLRCSETLVIN